MKTKRNQINTTRETLYGGPLGGPRRHHYVARLNSVQVGTGETKDIALKNAADMLLGAYDKQTASIYATLTADGTICTTREYGPNEVQFAYHREKDGVSSGICLSRCEINGQRVTVREYHAHYVAMYDANVRTEKTA